MSAFIYAELEYRVAASANRQRESKNLNPLVEDIPVASFDAAVSAYGPIREAARGRKKDQLDNLIAGHAVALGLMLRWSLTTEVYLRARLPDVAMPNMREIPSAEEPARDGASG